MPTINSLNWHLVWPLSRIHISFNHHTDKSWQIIARKTDKQRFKREQSFFLLFNKQRKRIKNTATRTFFEESNPGMSLDPITFIWRTNIHSEKTETQQRCLNKEDSTETGHVERPWKGKYTEDQRRNEQQIWTEDGEDEGEHLDVTVSQRKVQKLFICEQTSSINDSSWNTISEWWNSQTTTQG